MRDINYGFKAIEHRFSVLGGKPYIISDSHKIDLSRLLIDCYGSNYIGHPRMQELFKLNSIEAKDFLDGQQEALAFSNHDYHKLQMSNLRKVHEFSTILNLAINNTLKVNSKWSDIYGLSIQGFFNFCDDTWWIKLIWTLISMFLGGVIGKTLDVIFKW